jgi:hypothetical protein
MVTGQEILIYDESLGFKLSLKNYRLSTAKLSKKQRNSVIFYDHKSQQYSTISEERANEYIAKK